MLKGEGGWLKKNMGMETKNHIEWILFEDIFTFTIFQPTCIKFKVHWHITSRFVFSFDLWHLTFENAYVKCEHNYLLP